MKLLPRPLWNETFEYYSSQSVKDLKADIKSVLHSSYGWGGSINLTGTFLSEDEFEAVHKAEFSKGGKTARLKGMVFQDERNYTRVTITVRPNYNYIVLFIGFLIIGLGSLLYNAFELQLRQVLIILGFTVFGPGSMLMISYMAKRTLKDTFVKVFQLSPV